TSFLDLYLGTFHAPRIQQLVLGSTGIYVPAAWPIEGTGSWDFLERHSHSLVALVTKKMVISTTLSDTTFFRRPDTRLQLQASPWGEPIPSWWFTEVLQNRCALGSAGLARARKEHEKTNKRLEYPLRGGDLLFEK
ncbi:hypothetical protein CYLTODRAFT_482386, partial [Cylindrobasidium torrendii FP15055 ss-10]